MSTEKQVFIQGYDYEFIATIPDEYFCKICHLVLRKPVQTKCCGHRFCKECLQKANKIKEKPECPMDRQILDIQQDVFDDKGAERTISSLHIICPSNGCTWQGELEHVESHLKLCNHKIIECKNEKCKVMMPHEDMAKHLLQECEWRKIPCPHCDQMTGFCQLKAHEKICEQVTVECTNAECDVMKPRMEMTKHLEQECEWRKVSCPHCNDDHYAFKLQDHIKVCPKTPVRCPNECGLETINEEIADHVTNECPLTEVPCIYQQFGCQFLMQRKENRMEEHMEKATKDHLALACEELKLLQENNGVLSNRVSSLQDENESMFHRLFLLQEESMSKFDRLFSRLSLVEDRNAFLSGRLSDVQNENAAMSHRLLHQDEIKKPNKKTVKKEEKKKEEPSIPYTGTFVWKIGNVKKLLSEAKQGRSTVLFSEPFYTANHGYKLRAMLYPNGAKNENAGHMSIYAQIKRGEYDDTLPWPFGKDITFTLVDQKINIKNRKNIKDTIHSKNLLDSFLQCFQRPTSDTNKSIPGLSTFVKHDKLMSKSYAKGDSMVIIVDVSEATT